MALGGLAHRSSRLRTVEILLSCEGLAISSQLTIATRAWKPASLTTQLWRNAAMIGNRAARAAGKRLPMTPIVAANKRP